MKQDFSYYWKQFLAVGVFVALMAACGGKQKPNTTLQHAFDIHQESIRIRHQVAEDLSELKAGNDSMFVETYADKLDSLGRSVKSWDERLVEVPGFEESHDHAGHAHHEQPEPELTPEQHLEVQQYMLQEIKDIAEKLRKIKEKS